MNIYLTCGVIVHIWETVGGNKVSSQALQRCCAGARHTAVTGTLLALSAHSQKDSQFQSKELVSPTGPIKFDHLVLSNSSIEAFKVLQMTYLQFV